MESKYLYNFRKFNSLSIEKLKIVADSVGVKYKFPYLSKRNLAKKLAKVFFDQGIDYKSEFMEVEK